MLTLWPVLERELRVAARRVQTWRLRWLTAAGAMSVLLMLVWFFGRSGVKTPNGQVGSVVFHTIAGLVAVWALFLGCQRTADSLGKERRDGTLGLLFLTDLNGWSVAGGKLFAAALDTVFQLVAVVPVLVVPVLLGGVGLGQLLMLLLALGNGLLLSLVSGLLASLLSRDPRQAAGLGVAWILGLIFIPWGVFAFLTSMDEPWTADQASWVLLASPSVPFIAASVSVPTAPFGNWREAGLAAMGVQCLLSGLMFWTTAHWVRVVWQEGGGPGWRLRLQQIAIWLRFGSARHRRAWRLRCLQEGAWDWLSLRDVWKPRMPWFLIAAFVFIEGVSVLSVGPRGTLGSPSGVLTMVFHALIVVWVAGESAMTLSEQRLAGAFELLLTTGVSGPEILAGQGRVLRRLLVLPLVILGLFDLWVLLYLPWAGETWNSVAFGWWLHLTGIILAPGYWWAIRWASTRAVLEGRPINLAVGMAINSVCLLPAAAAYGIFGGSATLLVLSSRLTWSDSLVLAFLPPLILIPAWCLWWGKRQHQWVVREFRSALTQGTGVPMASA
jgi:ABC-2 family transporter protein